MNPTGIAVDASGTVYVADSGNTVIRKILPSGVTSTLAGSGYLGYMDGVGRDASFYSLQGMTKDSSGNIYVSDAPSKIRKISPTGVVTTAVNLGHNPIGVTLTESGYFYLGAFCYIYSQAIDSPSRTAGVFAGLYLSGYKDGPVGESSFSDGTGQGLATDDRGAIFISDTNHHVIRKIYMAP
jgi:sugar lactone lactonase YvrE